MTPALAPLPAREPRDAAWQGPVVEALTPADRAEWLAFTHGREGCTPFHLPAWSDAVEGALGHRPRHLVARRGGEVTGVLPLFLVESLLFGRALVSVPAGVGGGPLAAEAESTAALVASACELAERARVGYLELRCERPVSTTLAAKELYVTFRADLRQGEEPLLRGMERKRRQMLAAADRAGYRCRFAGAEELPRFYDLFCRSMRSHGTPVYSRRWLAALLAGFGPDAGLYFVEREGETLAGVLVLLAGGVVLPFYAGADRERRHRGVEEHLYWSLMRWGIANGFHTFDFGRSKRDTGAHAFKARWGMRELPLSYQFHLVGRRELPNLSPVNPRYRVLLAGWRRLPLPLTRLLGPPLVRGIP